MPELPEVETVRRGLDTSLRGRRVTEIVPADFPEVMGPAGIAAAAAMIVGRSVTGVRRRGKYLLIDLDRDLALIAHLRMTGILTVSPADAPLPRFHRVTLRLDNEMELRFADQRKFGRVLPATPADLDLLESRLGPEPLEAGFSPAYLAGLLVKRTAPVKAVLLDQAAIAGLGNIYVDEALFRSGIHPATPSASVPTAAIPRLHQAIRDVLQEGLLRRGTTFSSYRDATGATGENQHNLRVYGRGRRAEPCLTCGGPLATITVGGRTSHYCPACQPLPVPGT